MPTKLSALTSAVPARTDYLYFVQPGGTPLSRRATVDDVLSLIDTGMIPLTSVGWVAGADCTAAFTALTGGSYFLPPGTYYLDSSAAPVLTSSLVIHGVPGQSIIEVRSPDGFANGTSDGDMIQLTTNGSNTEPLSLIEFAGLRFHAALLPNTDPAGTGTAWPVDAGARAQWPQANDKGNGVTNAGIFTLYNMWVDTFRLVNCQLFMDDETHQNHHWVDAGGDSAFFMDLEEARYLEITGCQFYGSRDSAIYTSQVGERTQSSRYSSRVNIHNNYFEGCGNGVSIKGASIGGVVHDNHFVNCAQSIGATKGNADVSEQVRFHHNIIDGYWRAVRLQGNNSVVDNNLIFNGGHFAEDGTSMSDSGATLDDFFDTPYAIVMESPASGDDDSTSNIVADNDIYGSAADGAFGRTVDWGGSDPVAFYFGTDATGNRCINNRLHGAASSWERMALTFSSAGDNIISWSDKDMIEDHSWTRWTSQTATEFARGPVLDVYLTADEAAQNADTAVATISDFDFEGVLGAVYRGSGPLIYSSSTAADLRFKIQTPGASTALGVVSLHGLATGVSGNSGSKTSYPVDPDSGLVYVGGIGVGTKLTATMEWVIELVDSGTVSTAWAQHNSDATDTVVHAYSALMVHRVK